MVSEAKTFFCLICCSPAQRARAEIKSFLVSLKFHFRGGGEHFAFSRDIILVISEKVKCELEDVVSDDQLIREKSLPFLFLFSKKKMGVLIFSSILDKVNKLNRLKLQ